MNTANNTELPQHHGRALPPRLGIVLAIVLAIVFIAAVISGAKVLSDRALYGPMAISEVPAEHNTSTVCEQMVANIPDRAGDFRRVEVAQPAPAGVGGLRNAQGIDAVIRCGVSAPDQYTVLSTLITQEFSGLEWLQVVDSTPGSNLQTWYAVNTGSTIAVTSEGALEDAIADLSAAFSGNVATVEESSAAALEAANATGAAEPKPFPLSENATEGDGHPAVCAAFLEALPDTIGDYAQVPMEELRALPGYPAQSSAYMAQGREPVTVRCGVAVPESYQPGERIAQVNEIPWFDEPGLAQGSTSGRWYALGREAVVAVHMPGSDSSDLISTLTETIEQTIPSN